MEVESSYTSCNSYKKKYTDYFFGINSIDLNPSRDLTGEYDRIRLNTVEDIPSSVEEVFIEDVFNMSLTHTEIEGEEIFQNETKAFALLSMCLLPDYIKIETEEDFNKFKTACSKYKLNILSNFGYIFDKKFIREAKKVYAGLMTREEFEAEGFDTWNLNDGLSEVYKNAVLSDEYEDEFMKLTFGYVKSGCRIENCMNHMYDKNGNPTQKLYDLAKEFGLNRNQIFKPSKLNLVIMPNTSNLDKLKKLVYDKNDTFSVMSDFEMSISYREFNK